MALKRKPVTKKVSTVEELKQFREYLYSESKEKSRQHLLYPLFKKIFLDKFKIEGDAGGADIYIVGQLVVESKTGFVQWLAGFYQALHYQKAKGLAFTRVMVVAHKFIGIWNVDKLSEEAVKIVHLSDPNIAPNEMGKINAEKTSKKLEGLIRDSAIYWMEPRDFDGTERMIAYEQFEVLKILRNLSSDRIQINTRDFIEHIESMKRFFDTPIEAVHAFYSIVAYWDITSTLSTNDETGKVALIGFKAQKFSEYIDIRPNHIPDFKRFVEGRYIFTNEGSGLTVDYYFSRFDEVMARIDPEYVKQHGIFFTNINLSKFALWYAQKELGEELSDRYIWFDPAGGSGNLISSWRGSLKHKIISELHPDLLRIIERRMRVDPWHIEHGFTIIPRTSENRGLNFLDRDAASYIADLRRELRTKQLDMNMPIAFLLNPPYKNTDENSTVRQATEADYEIHPSIIEQTGTDAGKERYLAFLGQILNMANVEYGENPDYAPLVLIFTPTSWLIPKPTYMSFRQRWDAGFEYQGGFIITSNEFFKLNGKWPLAFTMWRFNPQSGRSNSVSVADYTHLKTPDLEVNWNLGDEELEFQLPDTVKEARIVSLVNDRVSIKDTVNQPMYDFKRDPTKAEKESSVIYGGLPLKDERRGNKKTYGVADGQFVGFMDDCTPVRVKNDKFNRHSNSPDRVWFRLDKSFLDINKSKCFNKPPDQKGFCAFDIVSAKCLFTWFSITKILNGQYPSWVNQSDIWSLNTKDEHDAYWHALCFAYVLAENRCVVTKFEANNPVAGTPEVFVNNPLCPANREAFWATTLDAAVLPEHGTAYLLVQKVKELYRTWNLSYCKGSFMEYVGLKEEPYFRYFDYPDFLTPYSGLIQIRKFAEQNGLEDILQHFAELQKLTKAVKDELYRLLVMEFRYFE